jgi:hypothetical protein
MGDWEKVAKKGESPSFIPVMLPPPSIYLESRMCMVWFCVRVPASPALHVVEHVNVRVLTARDQRERPAVDLRPNPVPLARGAAAKEDS